MLKLLLIFPLITANLFAGFAVCVPVVINHLKVANTDQTDFVIPVCANGATGKYCDAVNNANLAATSFKQLASGGQSLNASGFDINWFSDATCTSAIPFFFVAGTYVGTTGYGKWFVKKTVLTASDVTIYAGVGDAGIVTDQSSNPWPSTIKAAWPMAGPAVTPTGPVGAGMLVDATGNGHNLSSGASPFYTSQAIDYDANGVSLTSIAGVATNASRNDNVTSATGLPSGTSDRTIMFYLSQPSIGGGNGYLFSMGIAGTNEKNFSLRMLGGAAPGCINCCGTGNNSNKISIATQCWGDDQPSTTAICINQGDGGWTAHQIVYKLTSTGSVMDLYLDGALDNHSTGHSCNTDVSGNGAFLAFNSQSDCQAFGNCFSSATFGGFSYARMADTGLSADFIATDYNAVSSPQTFLTFGTPLIPGGTKHRVNSN